MIIDLTQLKKKPLTNEQKEAMIAKLYETEEGRAQLLEALSWMDKYKEANSYPVYTPVPERR